MPLLAEWITLGMVCAAPWAFGSVDAGAEFGLLLGGTAVALLGAIGGGPTPRGWVGHLGGAPGLALLGLALLGLFQATPLPPALASRLAPASTALWAELLSSTSEQMVGNHTPPDSPGWPCIAQNPDNARRMATRMAGVWLLFVGVLHLPRGAAGLHRLAVALALNGAALAIVALVQALSWNGRLLWVRPIIMGDAWSVGGPFDHHTHLAEYLNMGLGMALALALRPRWGHPCGEAGGRTWASLAAGAIAVGIVASNSRGGFVSMVTAGFATAIVMRASLLKLGMGGIGLVALVAVVGVVLAGATPLLSRLRSIGDFHNAGYAIRLDIWRAALAAWWSSPIWGTGLGTFRAATAPYLNGRSGASFARAENEYLDLLTEGGLVGLLLLLVVAIGVIRQARTALGGSAHSWGGGLILGAIFGVSAVAINSLSDYGLHVAGVTVPAVILVAVLCREGTRSKDARNRPTIRVGKRDHLIEVVIVPAILGVAVPSVLDKFADVRAEAALATAGLPGLDEPTPPETGLAQDRPGLMRQRVALARALNWRPGWAEGHLRLGMINLALADFAANPGGPTRPALSAGPVPDPARVVALVRRFGGKEVPSLQDDPPGWLLDQAARNFGEARRACPVAPMPHIEMACFRGLRKGGNPAAVDLACALRLAGTRPDSLMVAARAAVALGEVGLAARCWRRCLESDANRFGTVVEAALAVLTPDQILADVIPDGPTALLLAERLAVDPGATTTRRAALELALQRVPGDSGIKPVERFLLTARAAAALDRRDQAREQIESALTLQPENVAWRLELVGWLLTWGQIDEAHEQAKIAFYYAPGDPSVRKALMATVDALARRGLAH